jgi:hypothetical protein
MAETDLPDEAAAADHAPPAVEGGEISGRVTDFEGVPLVGVRVEAAATGGGDLDLLPELTDGDGRFALGGLAEGRYDLRFSLGRVAARTLGIPTGTADLAVKLARPQGILLVVRGAPGEAPPALLHVVLDRHGPNGPVREHAGRHLQSRLLLWSIRPGTYDLTVWGGPYLPVCARGIRVEERKPAPQVDVLLAARGAVVEGVAPPGALVCWRRLDRPGPWPRRDATTTADDEGAFRIQGLPAGRYRIAAGRADGALAEVDADVSEGQTTRLEVRGEGV